MNVDQSYDTCVTTRDAPTQAGESQTQAEAQTGMYLFFA